MENKLARILSKGVITVVEGTVDVTGFVLTSSFVVAANVFSTACDVLVVADKYIDNFAKRCNKKYKELDKEWDKLEQLRKLEEEMNEQ